MTYEPNRWRVLITHVDCEHPGTYYVFRNPPNAAFYENAGYRLSYATPEEAQTVVDKLNCEAAS